jgi:hypothetical protein
LIRWEAPQWKSSLVATATTRYNGSQHFICEKIDVPFLKYTFLPCIPAASCQNMYVLLRRWNIKHDR